MDSLAKEDNIRELKESLQRLPEDLDKTYDDALERIKQQDSRKLARADQVLTLISCAKRPLKLEEMRQALSIRRGDTSLDPEALPRTESFISTCCGLVVVEDGSQIVRLVHFTTEEYFKRKLQRYRNPKAHAYFANVLITYLSFTTFTTFSLDKIVDDAANEAAVRDANFSMSVTQEHYFLERYMESLLERYVLVRYAAEYWGLHVRDASTNIEYSSNPCLSTTESHDNEVDLRDLKQLIEGFLEKEQNIACANEVFYHVKKKLHRFTSGFQSRGPTDLTNLHIVASFGIQYLVNEYLDQGAEIDARDSVGMTALHKAARYGHVDVVRLLLESGAAIGIRDQWGSSALAWAVSNNEVSVSRLLLQSGSDPGFQSPHGRDTISIAAGLGHEEVLELLAEYGSENLRGTQLLQDALCDAAECERDGIVRLLVRGGEKWNISKQHLARAMIKAASRGHVSIMKMLLEAGFDVSSPLSRGGESLREAAMWDRSEAIYILLKAGTDPNIMTDSGDFPLHAAARNGHVGIVALLLENGADVNALNSKGDTPMVVIAGPKYGFLARSTSSPKDAGLVMQLLLENGANTAATESRTNRTSLECAIIRGHEGLVQLLLQYESFSATRKSLIFYLTKLYHGIGVMSENDEALNRLLCENEARDLGKLSNLLLIPLPAEKGYKRVVLTFLQLGAAIEAIDLRGNTALQLSAWEGHIAIVELLLHQAADIDSRGSTDDTPLMLAASKGRTDVVRLLIENGADIGAASAEHYDGSTAIARALCGEHTATARVLLERGVGANSRYNQYSQSTLLHGVVIYSSWDSQVPNIHLLLEKGADLEAKDDDGQTPLAVAVRYDKPPLVGLLLEKGADLEAKDGHGQTPLVWAVQKSMLEIVDFLLEKGADLEARDNHGQTPLMAAVQKSTLETVYLLYDKGANLEAKDNDGQTPLVMAFRSGRCDHVELLLEMGADPESLPPGVTAENDDVNKWDFDRGVKLVLEAKSKTKQ